MAIVECVNLEKVFGQGENTVHALRDINLTIESGEFVAIMGSSGSGKSTLLHIMGGIDTPTSGAVFIDGTDISQMSATEAAIFRRRKVGLIYQFFNLVPTVTVKKNILMPLLLDKRRPNEEYFEEVVHTLGLSSRLESMPFELSGGQQQRVAIARSLIYRPMLLLADEPTGNLDQRTSREIVDILKLSNRKFNQTTVVITHDEKVALEADRIITIEDGRILRDTGCECA